MWLDIVCEDCLGEGNGCLWCNDGIRHVDADPSDVCSELLDPKRVQRICDRQIAQDRDLDRELTWCAP